MSQVIYWIGFLAGLAGAFYTEIEALPEPYHFWVAGVATVLIAVNGYLIKSGKAKKS